MTWPILKPSARDLARRCEALEAKAALADHWREIAESRARQLESADRTIEHLQAVNRSLKAQLSLRDDWMMPYV